MAFQIVRPMLRSAIVLALLASAPAAQADEARAAATAPFTIKVPDGWTDLSPDQALPEGLPAAIAQDAKAKRFAVLAYDLRVKQAGLPDHVRVAVRSGEGAIEAALEKTVAAFSRPSGGPSTSTVVEQSIVTIAGGKAGRFVVDLAAGPVRLRQVHYLVPEGNRLAVITYSSTPERFGAALPTFEASAQATQVQRSMRRFLLPVGAALVAIVFAGAIAVVFRQRRRSAA